MADARHKVTMENRERVSVTGVTEVKSFDETCVVMETELGAVVIKGANLHVANLNVGSGVIDVTGGVDGVDYAARGGKGRSRFFARVFQ